MSSQQLPALLPDDDTRLPCDVLLPPRTLIAKGCSFRTLRIALDQRQNEGFHGRFFAKDLEVLAASAARREDNGQ
jgi:hypothetical protein